MGKGLQKHFSSKWLMSVIVIIIKKRKATIEYPTTHNQAIQNNKKPRFKVKAGAKFLGGNSPHDNNASFITGF